MSVPKQKGDLRILFWNIQNWNLNDNNPLRGASRFARILSVLRREKPDIALFAEVTDPALPSEILRHLGGRHTVFATNDKNSHQLMAIFRAAGTRGIHITQRNEFAGEDMTGRTFPLLEIHGQTSALAVMAAHTKARSEPASMKKRQYQFGLMASVAAEFNKRAVPLLVVGDMNTMGNGRDVNGPAEIAITKNILATGGLAPLPKDHSLTWRGVDSDAVYPDAELDHAFITAAAAPSVRPVNDNGARVRVGGWPEQATKTRQDNWVRRNSDHAYLVIDIKRPG